MTERAAPMTPKAFHALFGRIGARAEMPFPVHPHDGCGYALANAGHDGRCKPISATRTFSTRCATRSWHRIGSGTFGGDSLRDQNDSILGFAGAGGLTTEEWNQKARDVEIGTRRKADLYDIRLSLKAKNLIRQYGERWTVTA